MHEDSKHAIDSQALLTLWGTVLHILNGTGLEKKTVTFPGADLSHPAKSSNDPRVHHLSSGVELIKRSKDKDNHLCQSFERPDVLFGLFLPTINLPYIGIIIMASLLQIPTQVHNITGFWGPVDAVHQFCEPHYATSFYVCEFFNGLSSIVFVLTAWHCYRTLPSNDKSSDMNYIRSLCGWLGLIGIGSIAFHSTMRRASQFLTVMKTRVEQAADYM